MSTGPGRKSEEEEETVGEGERNPASKEKFGASRTRLKGHNCRMLLDNLFIHEHVKDKRHQWSDR